MLDVSGINGHVPQEVRALINDLRRMFGGKFRVWQLTHGHRFRLIGLVFVLLCLFLLVGYFDWRDMEQKVELHRQRAEQLQRGQDAMKQLPKTVFIIEAATPDELALKLARIAGQLDAQRMELYK